MALLAILAYAILAPICEEFLFRGVIQTAYEPRGPRRAVIFVGILFIVFHLSLVQGLSIILLSLALGYIYYHTRSLPASMIAHFGANFLAVLVLTESVFKHGLTAVLFSPALVLGGLALALLAWLALSRLAMPAQIPAQPEPDIPSPPLGRMSRLATIWPLFFAGILYLVLISLEIYYVQLDSPAQAQIQADPLRLEAFSWKAEATWQYEIRNVVEDLVGEGRCHLTPLGAEAEIICTSQVRAYEVTVGQSTWMSSGGERTERLRWLPISGQALDGELTHVLESGAFLINAAWTLNETGMEIQQSIIGQPGSSTFVPLAETPLAEDPALLLVADMSWPWQIAGLRFEEGENGAVVRFNPYTWRAQTSDSGPVWEKARVTVGEVERVETPAGSFDARKVSLGERQAAWYALQHIPIPVKFFSGVETWTLIE